MKYLTLLLACLFVGCLFVGCETTKEENTLVTAPARSAVTQAAAASRESNSASLRSSEHIKAFRSDAERIDYKATRALRILDHP